MNYASSLIKDMVNPEYTMFHNGNQPPVYVKIITSKEPSDITRVSLAKITEYLSEFVKPDNYLHHMTNTILMKNGNVLTLDENTIIVSIQYDNASNRTLTFQLTLDEASLKLN